MKKRSIAAVLLAISVLAVSFTGCGEWINVEGESSVAEENGNNVGCVEGCTCTGGCICYAAALEESQQTPGAVVLEPVQEEPSEILETEPQPQEPLSVAETEMVQNEPQEEPPAEGTINEAAQLTDGERKARREQQVNFDEARQLLYSLPNSKDKTEKINQMDRQILANNAYYFGGTNIVFIGDSITEGITSAVDDNGHFVSYVTYVNSYLHFANVLNHGKGGRMFATYGGDELSLDVNFGNVTNINADVIVVFAGVNDYLASANNKRFGSVEDKLSTAGYCGAVRNFMNQLQRYYSDRTIFFVLMYNTSRTVENTCTDVQGPLTLNDYLEVQRQLAKEFGFHVIDLYNVGFMDCGDKESSDYFLRDGLHPKDNGNIMLGEHIAAELSLYFGKKEID